MTIETLAPYPIQKFFADNGTPLAYGKLTTYSAGSTTPIATYKDSIGTLNTNPIILNARGECSLWLTPNVGYKLALTDSSGNLISGYPVDQIVNSQLLTLYAGVDTGSPNAYVLTYNAPYTSYTQGNPVIYFIAANSNTGPSTVNVNNLGIVNIVNPDGSALTAGQIVNNQMTQIVWQGGQFILTSIGATAGLNIGTFGAEASIASANVTDLGSTGTHTVNVTGSSVITSLGTSASISAPVFLVRFSGAAVLTYNAVSLITPSGTNINCNAGDAMIAEYLGSGNWKIMLYQSALAQNMYAVRTTTASVASSTAPAADTQLTMPVGATGTYVINGWLNDASGASAGGLNGGMFYSGSTLSAYWAMTGSGTAVTAVPLTAIGTAAQMQSAQSGVGSMLISGVLQATSTGTLSFNWAQNSSNATPSVVAQGSYLELTLVSPQAGSFAPITYSFNVAATSSITIPSGATTMTVECWGGSGGGAVTSNPSVYGTGGGSGGYARTVISVSGDAGQTISYTVGAANAGTDSSVSSGTFSITTMTASGGTLATYNGAPGSGGTASGGTVANTSGNAGYGSTGGIGVVGIYGTGSSGGFGGDFYFPPYPGSAGLIVFHFA